MKNPDTVIDYNDMESQMIDNFSHIYQPPE